MHSAALLYRHRRGPSSDGHIASGSSPLRIACFGSGWRGPFASRLSAQAR